MSARGFLGAGDLYIDRFDPVANAFTGLQGPFEAKKFEIKPNVDLKELPSRGRTSYGQNIESVALPKPVDFAIEMPEVNKAALGIALMGNSVDFNQGAGTWTDAPITVVNKDVWLDLGKQNVVAAGFALRNAAGSTTYVLGTDYEINYRMGWVRILPASAIAKDDVVEVTGSYSAVGGTQINGAVNSQIRARFFLDGINWADQQSVHVDVYEAVIAATSAFDFLSENFASIALPGKLKTPVGKTQPFDVKLLDAA